MKDFNFRDFNLNLNKPYPNLVNEKFNNNEIIIIHDLMLAPFGCLNSFLQYTYQSAVTKFELREFSLLLKEMAEIENRHLNILMDAIVRLKGNPTYQTVKQNCVGRNIFYSRSVYEILNNNIFLKKSSIASLNSAIEKVENISLKNLLTRIKEDEENMLSIFVSLKKKFGGL